MTCNFEILTQDVLPINYKSITSKLVRDIQDHWLDKVLPNVELFYSGDYLNSSRSVVLYGIAPVSDPGKIPTLKDVIFCRYPKMFHVSYLELKLFTSTRSCPIVVGIR